MPLPRSRGSSCPVCGAPFRSRAICPRCGADLSSVMRIMIAAWRLRNRARVALLEGEAGAAAAMAGEAMRLHATPAGRDLNGLAVVFEAVTAAEEKRSAEEAQQAWDRERRRLKEAVRIEEAARVKAVRKLEKVMVDIEAREKAAAAAAARESTEEAPPVAEVEKTPTLFNRIWKTWRRRR